MDAIILERKALGLRRMALMGLAFFLVCSPARAEDDPAKELGKFLGQHGYGAFKVEVGSGNRQVLEIEINGKTKFLTIDTGCSRTCLTNACGRSLDLAFRARKGTEWGAGGEIKARWQSR
jgi:hypothetical protein